MCGVPVNTLGQCWEAPYVYQIGDFLSVRPDDFAMWVSQVLAVYQTPVAPFPAYPAGATGLFDLGTGQPLASPAGGGRAAGVTLALVGDWGSGTGVAAAVASLMRQARPDLTFHIGDVYYVGSRLHFQTNMLGQGSGRLRGVAFPKGGHTTFFMNGNHEMISGGQGLFQDGFSYTGQQATHGVWQSDHWRVVALDTAYACYAMDREGRRQLNVSSLDLRETEAPQPDSVVDWLTNVVRLGDPSDKRGIVLFTHHQPISLLHIGTRYMATARQLSAILPPGKTLLWFFGHEHALGMFDLLQLNGTGFQVYPRLVGNGGFPITYTRTVSPFAAVWDERVFQNLSQDGVGAAQIGFNGFVTLRFSGAQLDATYVTTKCVAAGCDAGLDFDEGTPVAAEQFTVDLASGALAQRWTHRGPAEGGLTWATGRPAAAAAAVPGVWDGADVFAV